MSEFSYIPKSKEQSFQNNSGIFTPKDIYDLTKADKYTNYGQLELIETKIFSGDNIVDFTDLKTNLYDVHFSTISVTLSSSSSINIRFIKGGVVDSSSNYQYAYQNGTATGTFGESVHTSNNTMFATRTGGTNEPRIATNYFYNLGDSNKYSFMTMNAVSETSGTTACDMRFGGGLIDVTSAIDGIRYFDTGGALLTGSISLYGLRYS